MKHGQNRVGNRTSEHIIWGNMMARCYDKNHPRYKDYGGRGITVSESWHDFANFYADMGKKPSQSHTLDRKDNNEGYGSENCKWATYKEQANNTRRNIVYTVNGETFSQSDWCNKLGKSDSYLTWLRKRGKSEDEIIKIIQDHLNNTHKGHENYITVDGVKLNSSQWGFRCGKSESWIKSMRRRGKSEEQIIQIIKDQL